MFKEKFWVVGECSYLPAFGHYFLGFLPALPPDSCRIDINILANAALSNDGWLSIDLGWNTNKIYQCGQ